MHCRAPGVANTRLKRASAAVAALVVVVLAAIASAGAGYAIEAAQTSSVGKVWGSMMAGSQMEDALEEAGFMRLTKENSPAWLESELLEADQMGTAIANGSLELLWFTRPGDAKDAAGFIEEALLAKGWSVASMGEDGAETFVKERGECTWAMAECAQAGDEVAIVLHIRHT